MKEWNIYLSGEIHSNWREQIIKQVNHQNLPILFSSPVTDHELSDDCGVKILGSENNKFWHDHKGAKINSIRVRTEIKKHQLERCFHMLGSFPLETMPGFYANADCMLFSLKREDIFSITIPAKVQSYLASAKPILAMIDGEASKIIEQANAGLTCPSERPELLAKNIKKLSTLSQNELNKLGQNAINYYNNEFKRTMLIDRMESIFNKMTD